MSDTEESRPPVKFPTSLWESMNIVRPHLKCESAYYERLLKPEVPTVVYRFVNESKHRGRHSAGGTSHGHSRQEGRNQKNASSVHSRKAGRRLESPPGTTICSDEDLSQCRPFTTSLRKGIELDSKEAVCLMGLKKKIARLYAESLTKDEDDDDDDGCENGHGVKRRERTPPEDVRPSKRKRGRPTKRKNEHAKQSEPKRAKSPTGGRASTMASTSTRDGMVRDVSEYVQPLRRSRAAKRALLIDESSESEAEKEPAPAPMNDEELALQLHLDLNAPMLRKRRRSGGLMSPSNSEQ